MFVNENYLFSQFALVVAGSRHLQNQQQVFEFLDQVMAHFAEHNIDLTIISGMAAGPDTYAIEWAKVRGVTYKEFPADWNTHGRQAGPIRNREMLAVADGTLAFWDGRSSGTNDMISITHADKKPVQVVLC